MDAICVSVPVADSIYIFFFEENYSVNFAKPKLSNCPPDSCS